MKFQLLTLISIATTTTLAINLEQVRLINDDELIVQDGQFGYPAIINLKDEDAEIAKKTTTTTTSSSSATTTTTAKKDKKTTSSASSASTTISTSTTKSKSKSNSTSTSTSSSSKKHKSETASITKTGGADSVAAVGAVGGPILAALALLL